MMLSNKATCVNTYDSMFEAALFAGLCCLRRSRLSTVVMAQHVVGCVSEIGLGAADLLTLTEAKQMQD